MKKHSRGSNINITQSTEAEVVLDQGKDTANPPNTRASANDVDLRKTQHQMANAQLLSLYANIAILQAIMNQHASLNVLHRRGKQNQVQEEDIDTAAEAQVGDQAPVLEAELH